jgi:hypothetical protein
VCCGPAVDHRVATHKGERRRVEAMGNNIAPIDFTGSGVWLGLLGRQAGCVGQLVRLPVPAVLLLLPFAPGVRVCVCGGV